MIKKNVEAHLKIWLLEGRQISSKMAWQRWGTSRLAEYIRRLRNDGMDIKMKMVEEDGDRFGLYFIEQKPKIDRIATRAYMEQA